MTDKDFALRVCFIRVAVLWFAFTPQLFCNVAEPGISEPHRVLRLLQHGRESGRNYRASHICPCRTDRWQQPMGNHISGVLLVTGPLILWRVNAEEGRRVAEMIDASA